MDFGLLIEGLDIDRYDSSFLITFCFIGLSLVFKIVLVVCLVTKLPDNHAYENLRNNQTDLREDKNNFVCVSRLFNCCLATNSFRPSEIDDGVNEKGYHIDDRTQCVKAECGTMQYKCFDIDFYISVFDLSHGVLDRKNCRENIVAYHNQRTGNTERRQLVDDVSPGWLTAILVPQPVLNKPNDICKYRKDGEEDHSYSQKALKVFHLILHALNDLGHIEGDFQVINCQVPVGFSREEVVDKVADCDDVVLHEELRILFSKSVPQGGNQVSNIGNKQHGHNHQEDRVLLANPDLVEGIACHKHEDPGGDAEKQNRELCQVHF